jgi:hypothetical protein
MASYYLTLPKPSMAMAISGKKLPMLMDLRNLSIATLAVCFALVAATAPLT